MSAYAMWIIIVVFGLCVIFWYIELIPFVAGVKSIPVEKLSDRLVYIFRFIGCIPLAIPFIIDVLMTFTLSYVFGMNGQMGLLGGLSASIVGSIIIVLNSHKKRGATCLA